jgi:hypothetical protein
MGTERDFLSKQYTKDQDVKIVVDLGALGLTAAGITCKFSKNGGALVTLSAAAPQEFTLVGMGNNLYTLTIKASKNDTAGLATIYAQNGATQTAIKSFFIEDGARTTGQLYTHLGNGVLKPKLPQATIDLITSDILEESLAGHTTADTPGDKLRRLKDSWNDITAASVWDEDISAVVGVDKAGYKLYNAATLVWNFGTRTLTSLGSTAIAAIWNVLTSTLTTAGSIGKLLVDNVNAPIGTVDSVADAIKVQTDKMNFSGTDILSSPQTAISLSELTKADIVDKVLDESVSAHLTDGTVGKALQMARANALGKYKVVNATENSFQLEIYDIDNTTLIATFDVSLDANGKPEERST